MECVTDTSTDTHRGRPGYSRADVIRAAIKAFNTRGYEATSMEVVANDLGISKSALYHHISSKEEILEETVSRAMGQLEDVVAEAQAADATPAEQIAMLVRGSVHVLCSDPESVALLLRLRGNSEVEERALERRRALTRSVIPMVKQAQETGDIRNDLEAATLTRLAFGMVNSVSDWYEPGGKFGAEDIANSVERLLFGGLSPR